MDRTRLDEAIRDIRSYTGKHAELRAAHHFVYDLPLDKKASKPEIVILGINPGEVERDWESVPGPTEETWQYDFHENGKLGRSRGSTNWRNNATLFANGRSAVLGELFFWSSANDVEFKKRFGPIWESPHLPFCIAMIGLLIEEYKPKAILFSGLGAANKVAEKFRLKHHRTVLDRRSRLIEHYLGYNQPWFFTKHWSGAFGFSNAQKETIRKYIKIALDGS